MKLRPDAIGIVRGEGAYLIAENGDRYLDAISSWWVNLHGHSNPHIAARVSEQLTTLEHCIFAGFTHPPAVELAERLLAILPGPMSRIFYSDNGSTAVEVAIKMSLQYWNNLGRPRKKIVAIEGAYHGDTFGAMAVSARSIFTAAFTEYLFDVSFVPFPAAGAEQETLEALEGLLKTEEVAAFIAEPLVQGSAGMCMYGLDTLEAMFALCRKYGTLIIDDEVMTGFGRTGKLFAADGLQTKPDMICLSKGITGGTMAMGVTATTAAIFDAFYDDDKMKMLYHGHSYTANTVSCAAALASLDLTLSDECTQARKRIEQAHSAFAQQIKGHPVLADVRQTGTIIALEVATDGYAYHSTLRDRIYNYFLDRKILLRPLGNIIYILPPYCTSNDDLQQVYDAITTLLNTLATERGL
jgi:adenosylmethionine-8-amino-7-oxononanoate aminotransferase